MHMHKCYQENYYYLNQYFPLKYSGLEGESSIK